MTDERNAKRSGGRPRKAPAEQRTERLSGLRLTAAERAHVELLAERAGLSVAEFARRAVLGVRIKPRRRAVDDRAVDELHRIGVNLAQVLRALHFNQTPLADEIAAAVADVRRAIDLVADHGP